ncbi:HAMP domain-containing sensor histidine kinase [Chitinibacter sp. ZOR0017]|uniref:sensor histidine kinase n=1 Tax=Chitinibacter sp. ZOR0017 TaxID=1339254 RepID=UPI0018CD0017|nr:HAMP domain-containing sensor histidine kinase [Chitinibacter sp. ZOR0017]
MHTALARIDRVSREHPFLAFRLAVHFAAEAEAAGRDDLLLDACYARYLIHERRGEIHLIQGEIEAGIATANRLGLTAQGARLLQARGRIAQIQGRYQQAIEAWMQALELATVVEDHETQAEARIGLAHANIELQNPDEGRRYLLSASAPVAAAGSVYLAAKLALNLGVMCVQYQQWAESLQHFTTGLAHAQAGRIREYVAEAYWHIGHAQMELTQLASAETNLQQAIELSRQIHCLWLESVSLDSLATLFRHSGRLSDEITCLLSAYTLAEKTGSLARQLDYVTALVNAYERQGNLVQAMHWVHLERQLNAEHFKRSLAPVHRNMKALDLSEQDAHEQLLTLSLQELSDIHLEDALPNLLVQAKPLLQVEWLGLWLHHPQRAAAILAAEAPTLGQAAKTVRADEFPATQRLLTQLSSPLPLSRATLHEAAAEFARLLGQPITSLLFVPVRQRQQCGLLVLSQGKGPAALPHNWSRDDLFRASLLQQLIERQLAEDARQQLQQALERGERVHALGALVAAVAHELNTPVGVCVTTASILSSNLQRLQDDFSRGKLAKSVLSEFLAQHSSASDTLERNLSRVVALIERFRNLSKQPASDPWQSVNLGELLNSLAPELAYTMLPPTIELQLHGATLHTAVPVVVLAQILGQLFENAAQHAFSGRQAGCLQLSWAQVGDEIELVYQDDGHGVAAKQVKRIFDPFFTSKFGQGTNGLGLTRVYQLVTQQLHGSLHAESDLGQGLRLTIRWPWRQA